MEKVTDAEGVVHEVNQLEMMWAKQVAQAKRGEGYSLDRILNRIEGAVEQKTRNVNTNFDIGTPDLEDLTDDQIAVYGRHRRRNQGKPR
ncbi:hypothetical protein ACVDG5_022070 [Mesorhizobium sp. ORM6]